MPQTRVLAPKLSVSQLTAGLSPTKNTTSIRAMAMMLMYECVMLLWTAFCDFMDVADTRLNMLSLVLLILQAAA